MGQNAQTGRSARGLISIDWMLLAVAVIALLLLVGVAIRTTAETDPTRDVGGLLVLADGDTLVAFDDFSFDADGWSPVQVADRLAGLGPVLGPFTDATVVRSFSVPAGAAVTDLAFDLYLIGDWDDPGSVRITLGDREVMQVQFPGSGAEEPAGAGGPVRLLDDGGLTAAADVAIVAPRPAEPALPGAGADPFARVSIRLRLTDPPSLLSLRMWSDAGDGASWALDNLTLVARAGAPRAS